MSITIQLDATALQKLIDLGGPEFKTSMTQAAVAEITRRAFKKYLPDEINDAIDKQIDTVRSELFAALKTEKLVETLVTDRIEAARKGIYLSNFIPDKTREEARKMMEEIMGLNVRKIVLEKMEAPEGVQQLVEQRTEAMIARITKRFEGDAIEVKVEAEINRRVDELVRDRVAAIITNLQAA